MVSRPWIILIALAMYGIGTKSAYAQLDKAAAKQFMNEANTAYGDGRIKEALDGYNQAYTAFPHPAILFNIGQCYRQLQNCERAIFVFQQYLNEVQDAENRQIVGSLIAECEGELQKKHEAEVARAAELERKAAERQAEEAARQKSMTDALAAALSQPQGEGGPLGRSPPRDQRWYQRYWVWGVAAGVLASGVAAGVLLWPQKERTVLPSGDIGVLDRRTEALTAGLSW